MRDLIYHQLAQLLIESRGAYGAELARKRAVASRLMGDDAESRHWARVCSDAQQLLRANGGAPAQPASALDEGKIPALLSER